MPELRASLSEAITSAASVPFIISSFAVGMTDLAADSAPRFRILALDGGGVRGAFTASVLTALERETGRRTLDHFDLIVGTSTGGIVAIGLGLGLSAEEIRDFYIEHASMIFPNAGLLHSLGLTLRQLVAPKRPRAALEQALETVFGDRKLGESRCRLVLTCYDAVAGRIYLLKTAHHPRFSGEFDTRAADCALATAAAPTYYAASPFPAHAGAHYIDGGVWANCPALVGVVEAVHFLDVPLNKIDVLSIGTVGQPFSVSGRRRLGGVLQWNVALIELLMRGQAEAALAQASLLTGRRAYRLDIEVERGRFSMDDAGKVKDLVALGDGEGRKRQHVELVAERFLNGIPASAFEPAHQL
jgi:uncharacterized protein